MDSLLPKIRSGERLSCEDAVGLYGCVDEQALAVLADEKRRSKHGDKTFFTQNFHIEPSNVCIHRCAFCSFRRHSLQEDGAWAWSIEEMLQYAREKYRPGITEVHIVGSVHPERDLYFYASLLEALRRMLPPEVCIKAFSAVEIYDMCQMAGLSYAEGLTILKDKGLGMLPGGGAEIFDPVLRARICPDKIDGDSWLDIHRTAHRLGIPSNATMLFGHLETPEQAIDHLNRLRRLQDETQGFTAFIPLQYKSANNEMSAIGEVGLPRILRQFALARLFLDNIPHIKAYWPMLGAAATRLALTCGADDLDGTIEDSTQIYSMAGAEARHPGYTREALCRLIQQAGYRPVERNAFYRELSFF